MSLLAYIYSIGRGIPANKVNQEQVAELVQQIFPYDKREMRRLLPVFERAKIKERQLVVDLEWFLKKRSFEEKNNLYESHAIRLSLEAIDDCLTNEHFTRENIPYEEIDFIVYVSSTGITTPSLDAHILNERSFREDITRVPMWGLGCAGGAIGLSRTADFLKAHPTKTALLVCCELCSLTFQREDTKKSNLVGTALFGDGVSATLLVGTDSDLARKKNKILPKIIQSHSLTKKSSTDVMGWKVTDGGLEVIFSRNIPKLVKTLWKDHLDNFLQKNGLQKENVHSVIAHPGGRKVLEAMEEPGGITREQLKYSFDVLYHHGNMSSVTVLYILYEWMKENIPEGSKSLLSALGPGFSSESLLLEWE